MLPPPKKAKGKGEDQTQQQQWQPSLRQPSPVLPLTSKQPNLPPPGKSSAEVRATPPPKSKAPVSPPPKIRPVATPRQPPVPPPSQRAPAPETEPRRYSVSIKSKQVVDSQNLVFSGVSLSPGPA